MAAIRVSLLATSSLGTGPAAIRARLSTTESALAGPAAMRARLSAAESALGPFPNMRARLSATESVVGPSPNMRTRVLVVEALQEILEPVMASLVFPTLVGLAYDVAKKPAFSSKISEHTGGGETATSYYQNPKWEYKLTYDYLPDVPKSVGDTDLHTLMGMFLQCHGRGTAFLFQDPDDHSVTEGFQATMDGVTTQISLVRGIGGFYEPIGQLDQSVVPLVVYEGLAESFSVPATGPFTHTVAHAAAYHSTDSVTIAGVAAAIGTGVGQYTVAAGVYTFNAADHGKAVVVTYRYTVDPSAYSVTMPNVLIFVTAPPAVSVIYATLNYYFVCRFLEDSSEYTKFMDKLWNLSEIGFRSIPQ